jgi:hypothetical protein
MNPDPSRGTIEHLVPKMSRHQCSRYCGCSWLKRIPTDWANGSVYQNVVLIVYGTDNTFDGYGTSYQGSLNLCSTAGN